MVTGQTTDCLLESAIAGDAAAQDALYRRFAKRLEAHVRRQMKVRAPLPVAPEDIVQEVFSEVFAHVTRFRPRGKGTFYRLLVTIARRRLVDHHRRGGGVRRMRPLLTVGEGEGSLGEDELLAWEGTGPLTALLRAEEREICRRAFEELPEQARQILWWRLVEERDTREVSEMTGKSLDAVSAWFHRALVAWRRKWKTLRGEG